MIVRGALGHLIGAELVGVGQQQRELLAADARHDVLLTGRRQQPLGHLDQDAVAHLVAVEIVDGGEVVEVQQHQAEGPSVALGTARLRHQALLEDPVVGEPGEHVDRRGLGHPGPLAGVRDAEPHQLAESRDAILEPRAREAVGSGRGHEDRPPYRRAHHHRRRDAVAVALPADDRAAPGRRPGRRSPTRAGRPSRWTAPSPPELARGKRRPRNEPWSPALPTTTASLHSKRATSAHSTSSSSRSSCATSPNISSGGRSSATAVATWRQGRLLGGDAALLLQVGEELPSLHEGRVAAPQRPVVDPDGHRQDVPGDQRHEQRPGGVVVTGGDHRERVPGVVERAREEDPGRGEAEHVEAPPALAQQRPEHRPRDREVGEADDEIGDDADLGRGAHRGDGAERDIPGTGVPSWGSATIVGGRAHFLEVDDR